MTEIIKNDALPIVKQQFDLQYNEEQQSFEIKDYQQVIDSLNQMLEKAQNYEYHPDDRKDVKSLRTATNKMSKAIKDQIKSKEKQLFDLPRQQEKEITSIIGKIQKLITKGIDEEDKRLKDEKLKQFKAAFKDAIQYYDELDPNELEYKQIANSKWLNRSESSNQSVQALNYRLKTLNQLMLSADEFEFDVHKAAKTLGQSDWDGLESLNRLKTEHQEKLRQQKEAYEAELERQRLEASNEFVEDVSNEKVEEQQQYASILIQKEDVNKVKKLLQNRGIYFKVEE